MRNWLCGAVVIVLLAACGPIPQAKKIVADSMRDPGSAQFRNVRVVEGTVCGEVNGKNAYGAYAGFKQFLVSPEGGRIQPGEDDLAGRVEFGAMYLDRCFTAEAKAAAGAAAP